MYTQFCRTISLLALSTSLCIGASAQSPPVDGGWEISFNEEFTDSVLDPSKWHLGGHALHMNGAASISAENVNLNDGMLTITAEKRNNIFAGKTWDYASGELSTFPFFRQAYGYFEARIRYDTAQGAWPAFWLMPDRGNRGPGDRKRETFLRFEPDTTSGPVESAVLRLKVKNISVTGTSNITVHEIYDNQWSEQSITWNNRPGFNPLWLRQLTGTSDPGLTNEISEGQFFEVDITTVVNRAILQNTAVGFAAVDHFMRIVTLELFSKEDADPQSRPHLEIDGAKVYPTDDAYVVGGSNAAENYGSETVLRLSDPWVSTSSTYSGAMEFDIMESLGIWGEDVTQHAIHWDGYGDDHESAGSGRVDLNSTDDGFHLYGLHWEPGHLSFYVDGEQTWQYNSGRVADVPGYILLSLQMGGWDGNGSIIDNEFPATCEVDYVKVYKDTLGAQISFRGISGNDTIPKPAQLDLNVDLIEYGGNIETVEYKANGETIVSGLESPFTYAWMNPSRGWKELVVLGSDAYGNLLSSDTVEFLVADIPEVEITHPPANTVMNAPATFSIEITTASGEGEIGQANFFINGEQKGSDDTAPFSMEVGDLVPGVYNLTVEVVDELGLSSVSGIRTVEVKGFPIQPPWQVTEIGDVPVPGQSSQYQGIYLLENTGRDRWGNEDKMHFIYRELVGDGEISARLDGFFGEAPSGKTGLMIRGSTDHGSAMAAVSVVKDDGPFITLRSRQDLYSVNYAYDGLPQLPNWLMIKREEDMYTAYNSMDGASWTEVFSTIQAEIPDTVMIGLFASSNSDDLRSIARFDSVSLAGTITGPGTTMSPPLQNFQIKPNRDGSVLIRDLESDHHAPALLTVVGVDGRVLLSQTIVSDLTVLPPGSLQPGICFFMIRRDNCRFVDKVLIPAEN